MCVVLQRKFAVPCFSTIVLYHVPVNKEKVLTISQALNLIKQRGYIIKDDVGPVT